MIKKEFLRAIEDKDFLEDLMRNAIDFMEARTIEDFKKYYKNPNDKNVKKDYLYCKKSYKYIKNNPVIKMTDDDILDTFNSVLEWA